MGEEKLSDLIKNTFGSFGLGLSNTTQAKQDLEDMKRALERQEEMEAMRRRGLIQAEDLKKLQEQINTQSGLSGPWVQGPGLGTSSGGGVTKKAQGPLGGKIVTTPNTPKPAKHPGPQPDAKSAVQKAITRGVRDRENKTRDGALYVSDLKYAIDPCEGGGCPLELKGKLNGVPEKEPNDGVRLMFKTGDILHEQVALWLRSHLPGAWHIGAIEQSLVVSASGADLRGRFDIEMLNGTTGEVCIADVKTKRGNAFQYLKEPKLRDKRQVQAYMYGREADSGLLIYVDREGQNFIRVFEVERDDAAIEDGIEQLANIRDSKESQFPPLEPRITRNKNKGKDSLEISWPWQVRWCKLKTCTCRQTTGLGRNLPNGVVGWVDRNGDVELKPGNEWLRRVLEDHLSS